MFAKITLASGLLAVFEISDAAFRDTRSGTLAHDATTLPAEAY